MRKDDLSGRKNMFRLKTEVKFLTAVYRSDKVVGRFANSNLRIDLISIGPQRLARRR